MSTTTSDSTVAGKLNEIAGKARQGYGEATGDQGEANKGAWQEIKGHAQQAWGSVKEAVHDSEERHRPERDREAHNVREDLTNAAATVKQHIENLTDRHRS
jgi:uncharacterized protein YjbJ (UPF0337 family)